MNLKIDLNLFLGINAASMWHWGTHVLQITTHWKVSFYLCKSQLLWASGRIQARWVHVVDVWNLGINRFTACFLRQIDYLTEVIWVKNIDLINTTVFIAFFKDTCISQNTRNRISRHIYFSVVITRVTSCPGLSGTVPVGTKSPGQVYSGTMKRPGMRFSRAKFSDSAVIFNKIRK